LADHLATTKSNNIQFNQNN